MDPLTHTLVGACLAATPLGARSRRSGVATLVGANLPDVDVLAYFAGGDAALGFRRGWTHGIPAMVVLPVLLAVALWLWPGGRGRDGPAGRSPARTLSPGWLLALSYLAVLTHPLLDSLNTYGMRWWMPFSETWHYGDSVFIMDPWLWLALGAGWLIGRRPRWPLLVAWTILTALLLLVAAALAPVQAPVVAGAGLLLLAALLWRPGSRSKLPSRAAVTGLALATLLVASMVTLHAVTEARVERELLLIGAVPVERLMVGPVPANPLAWDVVVRSGNRIRTGAFSWAREGGLELSGVSFRAAETTSHWREVESSGQARGFLRWVRFPWLEVEESDRGRTIHLMDARYVRQRTEGFGSAVVRLPATRLRHSFGEESPGEETRTPSSR